MLLVQLGWSSLRTNCNMSKLMQMHCVISGHRTHTRQALPVLQNPRIPHQFGSDWLRDTHQWNREKSCQRTKDSDWSMPSDIDVVYHRALESCLKPSAISVILKERWQTYVFSCWWGSCKAVSKMQPWIIVAIMGLPGLRGLKWQENDEYHSERKADSTLFLGHSQKFCGKPSPAPKTFFVCP